MVTEIQIGVSSHITGIAYDREASEMYFRFKGGKVYRYKENPDFPGDAMSDVIDRFVAEADKVDASFGGLLHQTLKANPERYGYTALTPEQHPVGW